jgi:hypothetical protein
MLSRRACAVVLFVLTGAASALGADPASLTLMGVRLSMTPETVQAVLAPQSERVAWRSAPCPQAAQQRCVAGLRAVLPDGTIEVVFRAGQVWQVRLWVRARGEEDRDLVRDAAVAHYGTPDLDQPAWCRPDGAGGHCRADAPSLVFEPAVGAAGELVLTGPAQ